MKVFKDVITGEELFSDSYKMKLVDDLYWRVTGKLTTESNDVDESVYGGNASAEGGGETFDSNVQSGVDIVLAHRLKEVCDLGRKEYLKLFKEYGTKLNDYYKKNHPDQVAEFQEKFQTLLKEVRKITKDEEFQYFQSESASGEGMFALLGYEEDGLTPYMIFYKVGLEEEKH
uniref:Translationally controlled tumor protein n=1 Tax=Stichopus monotuberculatus TaxID=576894 RepID=A0A068FW01_STIMO|nr:translationally controlled tumor protein [Stichopus monotuberculatus]AID69539.1 translationally controlled tumor protein [Stichopus monotuberculatus]